VLTPFDRSRHYFKGKKMAAGLASWYNKVIRNNVFSGQESVSRELAVRVLSGTISGVNINLVF